MSKTNLTDWIGVAVFWGACIFLAFVAGMLVHILRLYPTTPVEQAVTVLNEVFKGGASDNAIHYLHPARSSESGVTVFDRSAASPGTTLVTSYWRDGDISYPGIRLLNLDGTVVNEWRIDPRKIWIDTPHDDYGGDLSHSPENYVHGAWLLAVSYTHLTLPTIYHV